MLVKRLLSYKNRIPPTYHLASLIRNGTKKNTKQIEAGSVLQGWCGGEAGQLDGWVSGVGEGDGPHSTRPVHTR